MLLVQHILLKMIYEKWHSSRWSSIFPELFKFTSTNTIYVNPNDNFLTKRKKDGQVHDSKKKIQVKI